jgi:hypothetical protein
MSAVWTVAAREIRARRILLVAIPIVTALPFAVAAVGGVASEPVQGVLALLLCAPFPYAVALGLGASLFSQELGDRRLGFYFARPISAGALWAGKVIAALTLVFLALLCAQLPIVWAVPAGFLGQGSTYWTFFSAMAVLAVLVLAASNAVASLYRSRSPWFLLDVVVGAALLAAFATLVRAILEAGAFLTLRANLRWIGAAAAAVMLAAALAQLALGRTDPRRGHAALAIVLFAPLGLAVGSFAAWQHWLLSCPPEQAGGAGYPLVMSPSGDGLFFRGLVGRAGFRPYYLAHAGGGSYLRLSPESEITPTFSPDGRVAAWISLPEPWEADYRARLSVARLDPVVVLSSRTPLEAQARWRAVLAVDPEGGQAILAGDAAVGIVDLRSVKVGATSPVPRAIAAQFLAGGRIRVFSSAPEGGGGATTVISIWSPRDGTVSEAARIPRSVLLTRRGDIAVLSTGQTEKTIVDLAHGTQVRLASTRDPLPRALVLADGRVALGMVNEVRITNTAGASLVRVPLPGKSQVSALRESEGGRLSVGLWSALLSKRGTLFVDTATGDVLGEEPGLLPAATQSTAGTQAEPGSLASRLFTNEDGVLIALEPGGGRRVIVPVAGAR